MPHIHPYDVEGYADAQRKLDITQQEWQMIVGAVMLLAEEANRRRDASDWKTLVALAQKLELYKGAKGATIVV